MGRTSELKRLWRKYRQYRIDKKQQRSTRASSGSSSRDSKDSMVLDETAIVVVGLGLEVKRQEEEYIEDLLDYEDPRFIGNPVGIGCSKTYEESYVGFMDPLPTSPASMRPLVPRELEPNEGDRLLFPELELWRSPSIDVVKGKRKGRMPGDSADDRYKYLLDGRASRSKLSAKKLMRVRQRALTR